MRLSFEYFPPGVQVPYMAEGRAKIAELYITVMEGRGLNPKSDPFVVTRALNEQGKPLREKKTPAAGKGGNVTWNSDFNVDVYGAIERLHFEVRDKDMAKSAFMGELFVNLSALKTEPLMEKWFPVQKRDVDQRGGGGELKLKFNYVAKGAILTEEQMMMVPPEGVLAVTVLRARNLQAKDDGISSDPFAIARIVDYKDREVLDYETATREKNLNPNWAEKFYFRLKEKHER